ncbi:MAG: YihY family inner membrane protein [Phycisphaerales bacterium]|nr:MAG: YihY family inner membrane protein [Phycisphaerales bacterium]
MLTRLLSTPTAQLGKAGRFAVFQIKLWSHCAKLLKMNRAGQQAAALAYHTIFGIVPLAIVTLLIFQSLPAYSDLGEKTRNLVYEQLHLTTIEYPSEGDEKIMLTEHLDGIVANFFKGVNKGSITILSVPIIIWAALALLSTIERAFNNIWHVARGRSFVHRVINYWAILTLGPLLLGAGIYLTTQYSTLSKFQESVSSNVAQAFTGYLVALVAFFLLYLVLPNTKVNANAAVWGAAVAALVWTMAKWLFGMYVLKVIPYNQIYGVLGLIPLGVFWIFITWLIVLFGLQLTFTTQYLSTLDAAEISAARKTEENFIANDVTVINVIREIAAAFQNNQAPVSPESICSKLDIPGEFGERILNHLVDRKLVAKTSDPSIGFVPARDPANISLRDIADAVAATGYAQRLTDANDPLVHIIRSQREELAKYSLRQMLSDGGQVAGGSIGAIAQVQEPS